MITMNDSPVPVTKQLEAGVKFAEPAGVIYKQGDVPNKTTKDLGLASAMHVEGCRLIRVDKTDPRKQVFHFAGGDLADRVERQWYDGTHIVSSSNYYASIRLLKTLIHNI